MGRPQKHENCPGIAVATKLYNDTYLKRKGRKPAEGWPGWQVAVEEVRRLDSSIQNAYIRKRRVVDGRTREQWEIIGKVCLACHEFWPDESTGASGFLLREFDRIMGRSKSANLPS